MSKSHPKVIKSREQYREYMDEFMSLFGKALDDDQDLKDHYELLGVLIQDYERKEFPPEKPSVIDAILFEMDQRELSPKDMIKYLGSRSKVSEVLSGARGLSKAMIKKLHKGLDIPYDILMQDPDDIADEGIIGKTYQFNSNCTGNVIGLDDVVLGKADRKSGVSFSF